MILAWASPFKVKTTQQTQNICITFIQRRPNVFDVGPTLYKCYTNVLCLLGSVSTLKQPLGMTSIFVFNSVMK